VVFQSENDLVVNTASMAVLARRPADNLIAPDRILDFDEKDGVYHTVYFRQERTVQFIRDCFGLAKVTPVPTANYSAKAAIIQPARLKAKRRGRQSGGTPRRNPA
jgi:hypothetical protein